MTLLLTNPSGIAKETPRLLNNPTRSMSTQVFEQKGNEGRITDGPPDLTGNTISIFFHILSNTISIFIHILSNTIVADANAGKILFFGNRICPFAHRAWWASNELSVPLDYIHIQLGNEKPSWYTDQVNPSGTVPCIYDEGQVKSIHSVPSSIIVIVTGFVVVIRVFLDRWRLLSIYVAN